MDLTLANGHSLTLREPHLIRERDRRRIERSYLEMSDEAYAEMRAAAEEERPIQKKRLRPEDLEYFDRINDVSIVALVESWTDAAGAKVAPSTDALEDLDAPSYAELAASAGPLIEGIKLDFSPTPAVAGETPTEPVSA